MYVAYRSVATYHYQICQMRYRHSFLQNKHSHEHSLDLNKNPRKLVVCDKVPQRSWYEPTQTSFSFKQRQDKQNLRCYLALEFPLHLLYVYFCWCHGGPRVSVERRIELTLEIRLQEHINDIQARKFDVLRCSENFDKASALA